MTQTRDNAHVPDEMSVAISNYSAGGVPDADASSTAASVLESARILTEDRRRYVRYYVEPEIPELLPNDVEARTAHRRRVGRIMATQCLFEFDAVQHPVDVTLHNLVVENKAPSGARDYAVQLVATAMEQKPLIDAVLTQAAPAWPLEQVAGVDRAVLRTALAELLGDVPLSPRVVVNEAIEIAKLYGGERSGSFVNGVLRTILDDDLLAHTITPPEGR